jgi:hypothetical protein
VSLLRSVTNSFATANGEKNQVTLGNEDSLHKELAGLKIAEFSARNEELDSVLSRFFAVIKNDIKYIKGFAVLPDSEPHKVTLNLKQVECGVALTYIGY